MIYLEIGTGPDPYLTKYLEAGHDCYFVEAHPAAFIALVNNYSTYANANFVNAAISAAAKVQTFSRYREMGEHTIQMSLDTSVPYNQRDTLPLRSEDHLNFYVYTLPFKDLLEWVKPDVVTINIEGEEIPILMDYDFSIKPDTFCIEIHTYDTAIINAFLEKMKDNGYRCRWKKHFVYCQLEE